MKKKKKDRHHGIRRIMVGIALALIVGGICIPAGTGAGEQKVKGEWILPENYPAGFDGYGYINRIAAQELEVVIDETLLRLAPAVTYTTPDSVMADSRDFTEGDLVGYLTNTEQDIISLWLIKRGNP